MSETSMRRIDELQADRALWGLSPREELELDVLLRASGEQPDDSWERAAGVATVVAMHPMPSSPSPQLIARLRASAPVPLPAVAPPRAERRGRKRGFARWLHPVLTAAAVLTVALLLWDRIPVAATQARRDLIEAQNTAVMQWVRGKSPLAGSARGDIVWNPETQTGYMRFSGLPANDPGQRQYQLWIVDGNRKDEKPIDGGVFDIPRGAEEVVLPIDPKLVVFKAVAFVVTVEAPGGTVVSRQDHVVASAGL